MWCISLSKHEHKYLYHKISSNKLCKILIIRIFMTDFMQEFRWCSDELGGGQALCNSVISGMQLINIHECSMLLIVEINKWLILTHLLWFIGNYRNLLYQIHCIMTKANGMALPASWQEVEQMGNHHAEKRQVENLPLPHFHIKELFPMLGEVWERYYTLT
jgi:hypothetical protein